jgi:hypothetical protein
MTFLIRVRTSKLNRSLARSKVIFSWMVEHDGYMKSWVKSYWHGAEMDNNILVLDQPWWFKSVIRAPSRIWEGTYEATAIAIRNDVSLDNLIEWFLMSLARSTRHGSKVNRHHVGYLLEISDTWALIGQNGYKKALAKPQWYGSMIDVNQWVHLDRSGRYATLLKKVKQGFKINKGGFRSLVLEKH